MSLALIKKLPLKSFNPSSTVFKAVPEDAKPCSNNTFGEGFDWASAPWFDANGLSDVPSIDKQTAIEKLQSK